MSDVAVDPQRSALDVESAYLSLVEAVCQSVDVPVAVKLSPYFSSFAHFATQVVGAGADGLVLFNRFYQPELDVEALEVVPHIVLSTPDESRVPIRWAAILYGRIKASMAITSGIHAPENVLQAIMAGADVTNVCSLLLKSSIAKIDWLLKSVTWWMEEHEYESIEQMKGSLSQKAVADPMAFERANYMKTLLTPESTITL